MHPCIYPNLQADSEDKWTYSEVQSAVLFLRTERPNEWKETKAGEGKERRRSPRALILIGQFFNVQSLMFNIRNEGPGIRYGR